MKTFYKLFIGLLFCSLITNSVFAQVALLGKPTPVGTTVRNQCPTLTYNLNSMIFEQPGDPYVLRWFNGSNPATATMVSNPTAANAGTYYAFFYNSSTSQYSQASDPVATEANVCSGYTTTNLPKYQLVTLTTNNFGSGNLTADASSCSGLSITKGNLIDNDLNNLIPGLLSSCSSYSVKINSGTFPANTFAGFRVSKAQIPSVVNYTATVSLFRAGTQVQTKTFTKESLQDGLSGSYPVEGLLSLIGYVSNVTFDEVRISFGGTGNSSAVYYAVVGNFPPSTLKPNTLTPLTTNNFGVTSGGAVGGLCVLCGISDVQNIIKPDESTTTIVGALSIAGSHTVNVKDHVNTYPPGTYAGFTIANPGLLPLDVLGGTSIKTFKDGVLQETISAANLLTLNSSLLTGSDNKTSIGFITTKDWNEIQYQQFATIGLLGTPLIYNAFVQRFENTNPTVTNNLATSLNNPAFPVSIDPSKTQTSSLCVNCQIQNPNNITSDFLGDYASIQMPAAALGANASIAVKNHLTKVPAGSFVGFEVESVTGLNLNLLESMTIKAYANGGVVQTAAGSAQLVGLNLASSNVGGKRIIGFVINQPIDELELLLSGGVLGVSLGETRVYRAIFTQFSSPTIACDQTYKLESPTMPVTLSLENTGGSGLACLATTIVDPEAIISDSTDDFALITTLANVLCESAIGIKSHNTLYPNRSMIEFILEAPNTFLQADLLNYIKLSAYKNGVKISESSVSSLLNLELLGLFGNNNRFKVSHRVTEGNFDEVKLSFGGLLSVAGTYKVFGAAINTRGAVDPDLNINCCSVLGFTPILTDIEDLTACTDETFNLNTQLANSCPTLSVLQWRTSTSTASNTNLVADPTQVGIGTYYAVCYDALVNCYSNFSEPLVIELDGCCPEIQITTIVNPTTCLGTNGSFTITGLRPDTTGYAINYLLNGVPETVNNITASNTGTYTLTGLSAGLYINIKVIHVRQCIDGSNIIDSVLIEEPEAPLAPTEVSANKLSICNGESTTLNATCSSGSTVSWYSDLALNNLLASNTVSPSNNTTYYAVCVKDNCKSSAVPLAIEVNATPSTPTGVNPATICPNQAVAISGNCTSGTIMWFSDAALTTPVMLPAPNSTTTYYAACSSGTCLSLAVPVTITVNPNIAAPTNLNASPQNILSGQSSTLSGTCASGTLTWYTDAARTNLLASTTITPAQSTTYYATCGTSSCALVASITVNVTSPQFLLAMSAQRGAGQPAIVSAGQTVTLEAVVQNKGNVTAQNVEVVAYVPNGLTVNDPNWTLSQGGALATLNTPIATILPGQSVSRPITGTINAGTTGSIPISFEISAATGGVNPYSTFDNISTNDDLAPSSPAYNNPLHSNMNGTKEVDFNQVILNICTTGNCATSRARRVR